MRTVLEPGRSLGKGASYGKTPIFKKKRVLLHVENTRIICFMSFNGRYLYIYPQSKWAFIWWTRSFGKLIKTSDATRERIMSIAYDQMKSLLEEAVIKKKAKEFLNGQTEQFNNIDSQVPVKTRPIGNYP